MIPILDLDNLRKIPRTNVEVVEAVEEVEESESESELEDEREEEIAISTGERPDLNFFAWRQIININNIRKYFISVTPDDVLDISDTKLIRRLMDVAIPQSSPCSPDEQLYVAFLHSACHYRLLELAKTPL